MEKLHSIPTAALKSAKYQKAQKSNQSLIPGLLTPLGAEMWPLEFQRRMEDFWGLMVFKRLWPLEVITSFPWRFPDIMERGTEERASWRSLWARRGRNLGALIQALFLPCQVTLRWTVISWDLVLLFAKQGTWWKGMFDNHQRRESSDIFIQIWGREEDEELVPVSSSSKQSKIWNFNKSLCSFCDDDSSQKSCFSAFRMNWD